MIPTDRLQEIIADAEAATVEPWYLSVCRELIELREQRAKVLALHKRTYVDALSFDCAEGVGCGHEDGCPTIQAPVCAACRDIGDLAARYPWEESLEGCAWPCDTARALGVTEEADQ